MNHASIIEQKGTEAIAEACGVPRDHVRVWKNRRIPRSQYAFLLKAFPDVTLEILLNGEPKASSANREAA